jgi:hypothetical protein
MNIEINKKQLIKDNETQEKIKGHNSHLRSSFLAKKLLIKGENAKEFEKFQAKLLEEMLIVTEIEYILAEKFISSAWKLKRATEIERNLLNEQNEITDEDRFGGGWNSKRRQRVRNIKRVRLYKQEIQHIIQHQIELEKSMHKALEQLRAEQALRVKNSINKNDEK